jgi:hypothetical protein
MRNKGLLADFRRALPDFSAADNVGSPYCVRRYVVDKHLGGPKGPAAARDRLARRGMRLILDFVPNHVVPDHPWVSAHPGYFIQGNDEDLRRDPASFVAAGAKVPACGLKQTTGRPSSRLWRPFPRRRPELRHWRSSPSPEQSFSTRGSLRGERCVCRSFSAAAPRSRRTGSLKLSTGAFLQRRIVRFPLGAMEALRLLVRGGF